MWDLAYRKSAIGAESFIADETDREAYELQTFNVAAAKLFNDIKHRSSRTNNMTVSINDLLAVPENPDTDLIYSGFTTLLPSDVEQVVAVFAKYSDSEDFERLRYVAPTNLLEPIVGEIKDEGVNVDGGNYYTTFENKLYVFPSPKETVRGGLRMYLRQGFSEIMSLDNSPTQIPAEYVHILVHLLCAEIAKRLRNHVGAHEFMNMYRTDMVEAASYLSERSAEKQYVKVEQGGLYR